MSEWVRMVEEALAEQNDPRIGLTSGELVDAVCAVSGISRDTIMCTHKTKAEANARVVCVGLMSEWLHPTPSQYDMALLLGRGTTSGTASKQQRWSRWTDDKRERWRSAVLRQLRNGEAMTPETKDFRTTIGAQEIIDAVCAIAKVSDRQLLSNSRTQDMIRCRAIVVGLMRDLMRPPPSYPEIARSMCRVTHSACLIQHRRWLAYSDDERKLWHDAVYHRIIAARSQVRHDGANTPAER